MDAITYPSAKCNAGFAVSKIAKDGIHLDYKAKSYVSIRFKLSYIFCLLLCLGVYLVSYIRKP